MNTGAGVAALVTLLAQAGTVRAQSINIDFGLAADVPSSTHAAAGSAGVWNSIEAQATPRVTYDMVDLAGRPTAIRVHQIGGTEIRSADDPATSGDDGALMDDALITYTSSLESCLFINGLEPGMYEVITYAWMPNEPAGRARVRHDPSPAVVDVGGAWPGMHVEGVTYARHVIPVAGDGFMGSHSGIVPGFDEADGAALNGIQLRKLEASVEMDAGSDGMDAGPPPPRDAGGSIPPGEDDDDGCSAAGRAMPGTLVSILGVLVLLGARRRR